MPPNEENALFGSFRSPLACLLFCRDQEANTADNRRRHRDRLQKDSAHRKDHNIVNEAHGRRDDDTVPKDLRFSKGNEEGIGNQRHNQKQRNVALPGKEAHHTHNHHQGSRHGVVRLGLFLDEEAANITKHANHIQRKARGGAQEKIADAQYRDTGSLDLQKPLLGIRLICRCNDQRGNDPEDLPP